MSPSWTNAICVASGDQTGSVESPAVKYVSGRLLLPPSRISSRFGGAGNSAVVASNTNALLSGDQRGLPAGSSKTVCTSVPFRFAVYTPKYTGNIRDATNT